MHVHFMVCFAVHTRIQPLDAMIQRARASKAKKRICSFKATVVPTHTHTHTLHRPSVVRERECVCEHCLLSAIKYGAILPFSHFERLLSAYIIFHRTILFVPGRPPPRITHYCNLFKSSPVCILFALSTYWSKFPLFFFGELCSLSQSKSLWISLAWSKSAHTRNDDDSDGNDDCDEMQSAHCCLLNISADELVDIECMYVALGSKLEPKAIRLELAVARIQDNPLAALALLKAE